MRSAWCLAAALTLVVLAELASCQHGSADSTMQGAMVQRHAKTARAIRGFKNLALSTARGFGKRGDAWQSQQQDSNPDQQQPQQQQQGLPVSWLADQMSSNPGLARLILRHFVDLDHDDHLSPEELLRIE